MKAFISALFLLAFGVNLYAGEYIQQSYKEKMAVPHQMFKITFDRLMIDSDYSFGSSKKTGIPDSNLALRGVIGFDGNNAYMAEPGENLKFPAIGNVNPQQGTMIFWTAGLDHSPAATLTNGKERGNNALSELRFGDGKDHVSIKVYECDSSLDAFWESSAEPEKKGQGTYAVCDTNVDFERGEWYQVIVTWSQEELALYVNGKLRAKSALPAKAKLTRNLKMTQEASYIGIRSLFYEDTHKWGVGMDDYSILDCPLSELEVANIYRKVCKNPTGPAKLFNVSFNGVDTGTSVIDKVEAVFDFSGLEDKEIAALKDGKMKILGKLTGPDGQVAFNGPLDFRKVNSTRIFNGVDKAGDYTLELEVGDHKDAFKFRRPDLSFIGNNIGNEDTVPAIWKDFAVKDRTVTLWNRRYVFGPGPLPERIEAYGRPLLLKCPRLDIDGKGIQWTAGETRRKNTAVTFTGKGQATDFTVDYETVVEFDGLIKLNFIVNGQPTINRMGIDWQVIPEASEYLLTPKLQAPGPQSFTWPVNRENNQIFLAGEGKGGFCWCAENDANWVYDAKEPVLFADASTGKCSIRMITRQVKMPEATAYTSLFIATPVRPITQKKRFNRCESTVPGKGSVCFVGADVTSGAFRGVFDVRIGKNAAHWLKKSGPRSLVPYNASDEGSEVMPEALYLRKYTEKPGAYSYKMQYYDLDKDGKPVKTYQNSIAICNGCWINDFLMRNNKELLEDKDYGWKFGKLFYDLSSNDICANPYHGCLFQDRFGREIRTFVVLKKRKLVERTVRFLEDYRLPLQLHSQRYFCPVVHGMCDFWEPGEQHCAMLAKDPMGWINGKVEEPWFRSEYNRDVLGVGVVVEAAVAQLNYGNYKHSKSAIAFTAMMMLYDIDFSQMFLCDWPVQKLWGILGSYDFGNESVEAHKFYLQKEVVSSNPNVLVTWYKMPGKRVLMVCVNRTEEQQTAEIDMSAIYQGTTTARDEYNGTNIPLKTGKFQVTVLPQAMSPVITPEGTL